MYYGSVIMNAAEKVLRRIIREELERVDEMPYMGSMGPVRSKQKPDDEPALGRRNLKGAEKLATSSRFQKLAAKHFANIPGNVWVAPLVGVGADVVVPQDDRETRFRVENLAGGGVETLTGMGFSIPEGFSTDDTVILYSAETSERGFIATPWMIVHAIFDSNGDVEGSMLSPTWKELQYSVGEGYGRSQFEAELGPLIGADDWFEALTMASARNGEIGGAPDALAEIMCQELLTRGGFVFNEDALDPEMLPAMEFMQALVKRAAGEVRKNIKGKLLIVAAS